MAQKTTVELIDDIDGTPATGTHRFAFDGTEYEIDLHDNHALAFTTAMSDFVKHARRVAPVRGGGSGRKRDRGAGASSRNNAIRAWARTQGIQIGDRGRIPAEVTANYDAAH